MNRSTVMHFAKLVVILLLFCLALSDQPVIAQEDTQGPIEIEASYAEAAAASVEIPVLYNSPPTLTDEQIRQLNQAEATAYLSPPLDTSTVTDIAGPFPGTESIVSDVNVDDGALLDPGDVDVYSEAQFGDVIPDGQKSNTMSSTVDGKGVRMFSTGNWFAANSHDKGRTWKYLNPFSSFPDFCCGQVSLYDQSRDIFLWLRTGTKDVNGENMFKLSIAVNNPFETGYWIYSYYPKNVNPAWTNQFWNAPSMQLGADFLYITWNLFNQSDMWVNTVILRFPLDALAIGAGFSFNYYAQADWFSFMPVSGAEHAIYFASNWDMAGAPYDSLKIWRWYEDSGTISTWTRTVPAWTPSGRGSMHCGTPNWLGRADMRLSTGARYEINNDGISDPRQTGRKVLGWWWSVAEGGGFSYPYIEAAAFYEDTMTLLPGYLGRPYIHNSSFCFAYPSFTPDKRGDLGGIFNYSDTSSGKPRVSLTLADDYYQAPPGWLVYGIVSSQAGPADNAWGDFNTVHAYQSGSTWIASTHYIPSSTNCTNCSVPLFVAFGRERDAADFRYSCQIFGTCIPVILLP